MGNVFTLDSLREEVEREYAPLTFTANGQEFVLRNLLRVPKNDRKTLVKVIKDLQNKGDDLDEDETVEGLNTVFRIVTDNGKGEHLISVLGGDLPTMVKLMEHWQDATQVGEAQDSPSS